MNKIHLKGSHLKFTAAIAIKLHGTTAQGLLPSGVPGCLPKAHELGPRLLSDRPMEGSLQWSRPCKVSKDVLQNSWTPKTGGFLLVLLQNLSKTGTPQTKSVSSGLPWPQKVRSRFETSRQACRLILVGCDDPEIAALSKHKSRVWFLVHSFQPSFFSKTGRFLGMY